MTSAFEQYTAKLYALAEEMARTSGDTALGNEIRDALDKYWKELNDSERLLARNLSEDLYVLFEKKETP